MSSLSISEKRYTPWLDGAILFSFSLFLRHVFFQGFVLGDDITDYQVISSIVDGHLSFTDQIHFRLFVWLFNAVVQKIGGTSEWSFFLPTQYISASLAPIGYAILRCSGYRSQHALLAGLVLASAPFEVMLGTVRSNDLFLEWFLALAFLTLIFPTDRAFVKGCVLGALMWCAFYVKMWGHYFLPILGVYYARKAIREKEFRGAFGFILVSVLLHSAISLFWKSKSGFYFPFLHLMPGNYPVAGRDLPGLFAIYPRMLFQGSEFHTTLFGIVPYLFLILASIKGAFMFPKRGPARWDKLDTALLFYFLQLFLLTNFLSTSLQRGTYYSPSRIFRYLAPISFPLTLLTGKLLIDLGLEAAKGLKRIGSRKMSIGAAGLLSAVFAIFVAVNIAQTAEATRPGRAYRSSVLATVQALRELKPPRVVCESWFAFVLDVVRRSEIPAETRVTTVPQVDMAPLYEKWLHSHEAGWEPKTVLITGLAGYVHYGCHPCGFRLKYFTGSLGPHWKLERQVGMLDYLPRPEPALLWVLQPVATPSNITKSF